jgi:tetratricopeptide (TPR) repeat protein
MRYKSVIIPAICFFLVVTIVFSGCSLIDFPNYVIQHYSFDGQEGLYNPNDPDLDKQMDKFNVLIERNPEDATYYYGRALAYFEKGQYDKAMVDLNKVIELSPEYAPAYNMRGRAYYDKGEYDKAISDCNKAIEIEKDPKYIAAYYYNRGFSYYSTGEYDKAIDDYTKAIEMDSKIDSDLYRKASKLDSAYYRRGLVYKAKGEYDIAASDFEKVVQMANDPKVVAAARQALKDIGK